MAGKKLASTSSTVASLKPASYNPRRISPESAAALSRCMQEFGDLSTICFNVRTGRIVTGHQRKDQLPKKAKLVKAKEQRDSVGTIGYGWAEAHGTRWPVRFVDWPEFKEKAANVAANSPLIAGEFTAALGPLLEEIQADDPAMFSALRFAELAVPDAPIIEGEVDPDQVPAPPDKAISKSGEIYQLGAHRLMCGDSAKGEDLDRLLAGAPIHLVNTDPPYNVKVEPRSNNAIAAGLSSFGAPGLTHHQGFDLARGKSKARGTTRKMRARDRPLENDFVSDEAFEKMLQAWFGNIARVLLPGRGFYIWGGYANCGNYPPVLKACELYFSQAVIWVKEHPVLTRKDFMGNHEWCFYGWRLGAGHKYFGPPNATDVWSIKKVNPASMVHLTEKPVELATRAMEYSSKAGENVLDLFGGSGSTLIAAEQTGRHAFLMELDAPYCDVIRQRWAEFVHGVGCDWKKMTPGVD